MAIINLTPHDVIVIVGKDTINFKKCVNPARVETQNEKKMEIEGIPCYKTTFGKVCNLPEPAEGDFYIVSQIIKSALPERTDLLVPAEVVRDTEGKIVGCRGFQI